MVVEKLTYSITQLLFATMKWASVPANPHDSSNLQEVRVPMSNKPRLELLYPAMHVSNWVIHWSSLIHQQRWGWGWGWGWWCCWGIALQAGSNSDPATGFGSPHSPAPFTSQQSAGLSLSAIQQLTCRVTCFIGSMRSSRMDTLQVKRDQNKSAMGFLWCVYHQTVKQISLWRETDMLSSLSIFSAWVAEKKHDIPWRLEDFERRSSSLHQAQKFEVAKNINKRYNTKSTPERRALKTSCRLEWGPNRCRFRFWNVHKCSNSIKIF